MSKTVEAEAELLPELEAYVRDVAKKRKLTYRQALNFLIASSERRLASLSGYYDSLKCIVCGRKNCEKCTPAQIAAVRASRGRDEDEPLVKVRLIDQIRERVK